MRICNLTCAGPASPIILAALVAKDLQGGIEDGEKTDALDCNPRALFNSDLGCQQVAGKHLRLFGGQTEFVREEWTQQLLVNGSASGGVKAAPDALRGWRKLPLTTEPEAEGEITRQYITLESDPITPVKSERHRRWYLGIQMRSTNAKQQACA